MAACRQIITPSLTKLCVLKAGYWLFLVLFRVASSANRVDRSGRSTSPQSRRHRFNLATIGLQHPVESYRQWSNTLRILARITQSVRLRAFDVSHRHGACNSLSRNACQCCCTSGWSHWQLSNAPIWRPACGALRLRSRCRFCESLVRSQCARLHSLRKKAAQEKPLLRPRSPWRRRLGKR